MTSNGTLAAQASTVASGRGERNRALVYTGTIGVTTLALAGLMGWLTRSLGGGAVLAWWAGLLAVPVTSRIAQQAVHTVLQAILPDAAPLSDLDAQATEAAVARTCLVYPVIVHDEQDVEDLLTTMRDSRRDAGSGFVAHVALVDFADGNSPTHPGDEKLSRLIEDRIRVAHDCAPGPPMFALFRARKWNSADGVWMGWERKRGKIVEFVRVVNGSQDTTFLANRTATAALQGVRFVITLDVCSRLCPGSARQLVATIAHPDNCPVVDRETGQVVSGFTFLRPLIASRRARTLFAWATRAKQRSAKITVMQQLFGRDHFFGQGIFEVTAFAATLNDSLPENAVLNHDKIEGMYARAAYESRAMIIEDSPEDYLASRLRDHRWARGDIHLIPWLFAGPKSTLRRLPLLDRYRVLDDAVGHLLPPVSLALLACGWLALPGARAGLFAAVVVLVPLLAGHVLFRPILAIARPFRRRFISGPTTELVGHPFLREHYRHVRHKTLAELASLPTGILLMADRAVTLTDAVVRAGYRTVASHRGILQWTAARTQTRQLRDGVWVRYRTMRASCVLSLVLAGVIWSVNPSALPFAVPLLMLWLVAPLAVYYSAKPTVRIPFTTR
ncbi:hypothetical protein [Micromonospora sp. KC721]|uniref:hypothetical protein n=1 Tax=Micromonospora sp. KC721 TaxID=2530380 RepID=UPI00104CF361|nr:hypothetical protein [Micromonospora sp. KC721]TDB82485.1 hypothetical protein E1182_01520 [Micromonospora sp. KC721]